MNTYNIVLFGVKETTRILAEYLHAHGIKVNLIISLDKALLQYHDIANYEDLKPTADAIGADYYCVTDYSLKNEQETFFQNHKFVTGIVYGWQRLIPKTILDVFAMGVFGFHASPDLLPQGKGRSPLNWGLILGKTRLYNHCFKYDAGADSGNVHSVVEFAITPYDTILTLLYKSLLTAKKQILVLLQAIENGTLILTCQQGESYFFPKRSPKDGLINFEVQTTNEIVNLIRGVTKPFPGAFCYYQNKKIIIWEAWPFDQILDFSQYQPGEVIDTLYNMPVIKTVDGSIIVKNYEGSMLKEHNVLNKEL